MGYLLIVWMTKNGKRHDEMHEFRTLEEMQDFAEYKAGYLRKNGYEFGILLYKRIDE